MNFFECVKFDKELTENDYCTITYSGELFKNNSDIVSIVYGYDENWAHTTEQKMNKTEDGFVVDVKLRDGFKTLYFCFKNSYNQWDNNDYKNYWAPINKQLEKSFIINENVIHEILNNLVKDDLAKIQPSYKAPQEESLNIEESLVNTTNIDTLDKDIENIFNDIYEENSSDKKDLLDNILSSSNKKDDTKVEENNLTQNIISESDETDDQNNFNVNSLINEILSPIVSSSVFEEENLEDLQNFKTEEENEDNNIKPIINDTQDVQDISNDFNLDTKVDSLISNLYNKNVETNINNFDDMSSENTSKDEDVENIEETTTSEESNINTYENNETEDNDTYESADYDTEASLIDVINNDKEKNEEKSLIEVPNDNFIVSSRSLSKFYLFKKKIKLAFYKLFVAIPKLLTGNLNEDNH